MGARAPRLTAANPFRDAFRRRNVENDADQDELAAGPIELQAYRAYRGMCGAGGSLARHSLDAMQRSV